jgi:hypothetical protein
MIRAECRESSMTLPVIEDPLAKPEFYIRLDDKLLDMFFLNFQTAHDSVRPWIEAGRKVEILNRARGDVIVFMRPGGVNASPTLTHKPLSEPEPLDATS